MRHRLTEVDTESRKALCSICGMTKIMKDGTRKGKQRWSCIAIQRAAAKRRNARTGPSKASGTQRASRTSKARRYSYHRDIRCCRCGFVCEDIGQMDADHIAGRNIPDPDNPSNLQTLCANCHRLRSVVPDIFAQVPDHAIGDVSWFLYIQFPEYEGIRE